MQNVKKLKSEEDWDELRPKILCLGNPMQNIWNKLEKSSKTGQDKKSLISTFACFLTATVKVKFLDGRLGTRLCF